MVEHVRGPADSAAPVIVPIQGARVPFFDAAPVSEGCRLSWRKRKGRSIELWTPEAAVNYPGSFTVLPRRATDGSRAAWNQFQRTYGTK